MGGISGLKDFLLSRNNGLGAAVMHSQNEAGKSCIRDAIQWYFTGQARGLKTQQEQAALIRDGGRGFLTQTMATGAGPDRIPCLEIVRQKLPTWAGEKWQIGDTQRLGLIDREERKV